MGENAIPILESFGGLEVDTERTSRTPGRASLCTNMQVGAEGRTLRKMAGATRVGSQVGSGSNLNILGYVAWTDRFGVTLEVIKVETLGYFARDIGSAAWTQITALPAEGDGVPSFAVANGVLYIVDGYSAYFSLNGLTTWNRLSSPKSSLVGGVGINAPSAVAIAATNKLTKDAEYEVTFVFGDDTIGQEDRHSAPAPIFQVRTTKANTAIRIDTGYAGRDESTATLPDKLTSFLHLPADVVALGANAFMIGLISEARKPGVWYQPKTTASPGTPATTTRQIPRTTAVDADSASGQKVLNVTSTTGYLVDDQVVIDPDSSGGGIETGRIASIVAGASLTLDADLTNAHSLIQADKVVPILSLVFDTETPTTDQYKEFYGPPEGATGIVSHFDAIWAWGSPNFPTRIWFTDPDAPETFPANNFIDVDPDNPDDPIMALVPFGKGFGAELLVLRLNSVWRLQGNSVTTFATQLVQAGPSCVGENAAVAMPDGTIIWAGFEDVYRFDGSSILSLMKDRVRHDYRSSFNLADVGGKRI